jgi:hypothetical protein
LSENGAAGDLQRPPDGKRQCNIGVYSSTTNSGGLFGYAIDIDAGRIAVSAPGENSG